MLKDSGLLKGEDRREVKDMLCHMVIDLSKELCTRSDDRTKLVQRKI